MSSTVGEPDNVGPVSIKTMHILIVLAQVFVVPSVGWMISTIWDMQKQMVEVNTKLETTLGSMNLSDSYTSSQATQDQQIIHNRIQQLENRVTRNEGWIRDNSDNLSKRN